jgi:phosphatidylinositol glycan class M
MFFHRFSWRTLFTFGLVIRLLLVGWGELQDRLFQVAYTDVDYLVFSDGAKYIAQGGSPYERATYRYSPLIAYLFVPNFFLGTQLFGKLLLVLCDLVAAHILRKGVQAMGYAESSCKNRVSLAYLFNPLIINITTRGNSETLTLVLLLYCFFGLVSDGKGWKGRFVGSAVCLGVAAHIRLFPVLNGLPIALFLLRKGHGITGVLSYGVVAVGALMGTSFLAYSLYGMEYVNHAVLYHATRSDHRHSLSLAFPSLYLLPSVASYLIVPQLICSLTPTLYLFYFSSKKGAAATLASTLVLQSGLMVACSRVLTVQYFAWWIPLVGLMPLNPQVDKKWPVLLWVATLASWLAVAYHLEFKGSPWSINMLQYCGSAFFLAQINLLSAL